MKNEFFVPIKNGEDKEEDILCDSNKGIIDKVTDTIRKKTVPEMRDENTPVIIIEIMHPMMP